MGHRIRLAPINTGLYVDGESTVANEVFFQSRASSGVDICMVGNVAVSEQNVPNGSCGVMSSSSKWAQLASVIRHAGSSPGVQLSATLPGYRGQTVFTAADQEKELHSYQLLFDQMTRKDWASLALRFCDATDLSLAHGFEHVQIHAAHGYAFSVALDPKINPASVGLDRVTDVLRHVCEKFSKRASLRVSWYTGLAYDDQRQARILDLWQPFASRMDLDLSNGYYNLDKLLIYPPHQRGEAPYLLNAITLAQKYPEASFIIAGNVWNPYRMAERCPPNIHFSLARALIADPYHLASMRKRETMLCDDCGACHFFSTGKKNITCPKWPK